MKEHFRPHNKRKPGKQSTTVAPGVYLKPSKTPEGCFFIVRLASQRQPGIKTDIRVPWTGSLQALDMAIDVAIIHCAEHQHFMYGDEWDIADLRIEVREKRKKLISDAKQAIKKVTGR